MPADLDFDFWKRVSDFWNPVQSAGFCISEVGRLPIYVPSAESVGTRLWSLEETEEASGGFDEEIAALLRLRKGGDDE